MTLEIIKSSHVITCVNTCEVEVVVKQNVTLVIDKEVYEKAHALGINVSKACENYLKQLIEAIETLNSQKDQKGGNLGTVGSGWCGRRDLNPGRQRGSGEIDWERFREFCFRINSPEHAKQLFSYAQRYYPALLQGDFSSLRDLSDTMRPNAMRALSALSKFLGCHDVFRELVRAYGLRWRGKSADDLFLERLGRVSDPEEVWRWIRDVKAARSDLCEFMDLMALSGMRLVEGVCSYNLIIELSREGKLDSYYVHGALEHYRFKELFIRKSKKAFVSFVPAELVSAISNSKKELLTSADAVQKLVQKRGLPLRFADIREAHGTFMTKFLKPSEIDFLHGRVTSSVFMQHYFNPALIGDLRERVLKGVSEILEKVKV